MSFSNVLLLYLGISALALTALVVVIVYTIRRRRLPEACSYNDLAKRIATATAELTDITKRLDESRSTIEMAEQAKTEMNATRDWMTANKDELLAIKAQREEQETLKSQIGAAQDTLTGQRTDLERVTSERVLTQSTVEALRKEQANLSANVERSKEELRHADTAMQRNRAETATGEARLEALHRSVVDAEAEIAARKASVAELTAHHDTVLDKIRVAQGETRAAVDDSNRAKQQAEAAKAELADLQQRLQTMSEYIDKITQEGKILEAQRADLERVLAAARHATDEAVAERDRVRAKLETASEALAKVTGETAALRGERDALQGQIDQMQQYLAELRGMLKETGGDSNARYRDLWDPLTFPKMVVSDAVREQKCLENTQRHLLAVGLKFPPRVLNAFHAALKTADMSPLVVLAGISGTGKSQLPKRYTEGMGIHFVPLAVQPRWDSPQDLFGFFNHLEKRYKATELARAMVQFERHTFKTWPEARRKAGAMSNQMLLVLLDEMNLARVEYYFSEFLSRLEFRRDIGDPATNEQARSQAEIRLDMGALADGEKEIRLYPDRNILFTGTMNEDESTQTLSDKVLDRSCVLRFGRPRMLDHDSDPKKRNDVQMAKHAVSLDQWMSWTDRRLSATQMELVGNWTGKLNEIMDHLHRPFGHRVAKSIHQYVTQYPDFAADERTRLKWAMADQIEQRILPKLRGIDLQAEDAHAPLDQLRDLIADVGDTDLRDAYESCRARSQQSGQPFMWRGLDRTA